MAEKKYNIKFTPRPLEGTSFVAENGKWKDVSTTEQKMSEIRSRRKTLLKQSDWTQVPDAPLSDEMKEKWRVWRQHLRDVTKLPADKAWVRFLALKRAQPK